MSYVLSHKVLTQPNLDPFTRLVLAYVVGFVSEQNGHLFWKSATAVAAHLDVGLRTVERVFAQLRAAGVFEVSEWPEAIAGPRRTRCVCYRVVPEHLAKLGEGQSNTAPKAALIPPRPQGNAATTGRECRTTGGFNTASQADESKGVREGGTGREQPPPPQDDPWETLEGELASAGFACDERALTEWRSLFSSKPWSIPTRSWAMAAVVRWLVENYQGGRMRYAREAEALRAAWEWDRGAVLNAARRQAVAS